MAHAGPTLQIFPISGRHALCRDNAADSGPRLRQGASGASAPCRKKDKEHQKKGGASTRDREGEGRAGESSAVSELRVSVESLQPNAVCCYALRERWMKTLWSRQGERTVSNCPSFGSPLFILSFFFFLCFDFLSPLCLSLLCFLWLSTAERAGVLRSARVADAGAAGAGAFRPDHGPGARFPHRLQHSSEDFGRLLKASTLQFAPVQRQ